MENKFNLSLFTNVLNRCIDDYKKSFLPATIGLRGISKQIGVSTPTLSRLMRGNMPDVPTLATCLVWMNCKFELFLTPTPNGTK